MANVDLFFPESGDPMAETSKASARHHALRLMPGRSPASRPAHLLLAREVDTNALRHCKLQLARTASPSLCTPSLDECRRDPPLVGIQGRASLRRSTPRRLPASCTCRVLHPQQSTWTLCTAKMNSALRTSSSASPQLRAGTSRA